MNDKRRFFIIFLVAFFFLIGGVNASDIDDCQPVPTSGVYELTGDISGTGTCLTITADDVEIDCKGHFITYGTDGQNGRLGINANDGTNLHTNLTIKNCNIIKSSAGGTTGYGIYLNKFSNSNIFNNTIKTNGTTGNNGIYITTNSSNNNITGNDILTNGTTTSYGIYFLASAGNLVDNNTIDNNVIQTNCRAASSACHGIYLQNNANYNNITNNNISTNGTTANYGIYFYGTTALSVNSNLISSNTITTNGTGANNYGIYLITNANQNNITNNTISTDGTSGNLGIAISGTANASNENLIYNNTIRTNGTSTTNYGIYILTNSSNNNITGNDILTNGTTTSYGIYFLASAGNLVDNNTLDNNIIQTNCRAASSACHGIYILRNSNNNNITNNNISTNGTTTNYGIYLYGTNALAVNSNLIFFNNVTTAGTGASNYGIYISTNSSYNNVTYNTILANGTTGNYGIYLVGAASANSDYNLVDSNNLMIVGTAAAVSNIGIRGNTNTNNNNITNNGVWVYGTTNSQGIYLTGAATLTSDNNLISSNTIWVNGSAVAAATDYGIYLSANTNSNNMSYNNITTVGSTTGYGIYVFGATTAPVNNNTIHYNNITTIGTGASNRGVTLSTNANSNNVTSNTISTSGTTASYGIVLIGTTANKSDNNLISSNNITTAGTGASNHGIYLTTNTSYNNVTYNTIIANGTTTNYGIYLVGGTSANSDYNLIDSNNLTVVGTAAGVSNVGIFGNTNTNNNNITNNNVSVSGTTANYGVYIIGTAALTSDNNLVSSNNFQILGTTTNNWGVYLVTNVNSNKIRSNVISTSGTNTNYGVYILGTTFSAISNELFNNTISISATGTDNYGVYLLNSVSQSNISYNSINTSGTTQNRGIYMTSSMDNTISYNVINTSGTTLTSDGFYLLSASTENIISHNVVLAAQGHGFNFVYSTTSPDDNILRNNTLNNIAGSDLYVASAVIEGIQLIDQPIGMYNFTLTGSNGMVFENTENGKISFLEDISGNGTNLSSDIQINYNNISIDSASKPGLNKSATLTFYNMSAYSAPAALRNEVLCPASICGSISVSGSNISFSVTGWTFYSVDDAAPPLIILFAPDTNLNTSSEVTFQFKPVEESLETSNCSLYINSVLDSNNATTLNDTNTEFVVSDLVDGLYYWNITCRNSYGASNTSETRVFYMDLTFPSITLIIYSPNSTDEVDPGTDITINATVTDNRVSVSSVILQYYNGTGWANTTMSNTSTTNYNATITTLSSEANYTFNIWANDSLENGGASANQTFESLWDCSWVATESLEAVAGWDENKWIENLTINNTGDSQHSTGCNLDFRLTHSFSESEKRIYFDGIYYKPSSTYSVSPKENLSVSVNASFLDEVLQESFSITITDLLGITPTPTRNITGILVSNQAGPYLYQSITSNPSSIYLTPGNFSLNAYLKNLMGNSVVNESNTAYNVSFNWTLPSGLTNVSGNLNVEFTNITNSSSNYNNIGVGFSNLASFSPGVKEIELFAQGYNLTGSLIQDTSGNLNLTNIINITFLCYNTSDGLCVTSCGYTQDSDCEKEVVTETTTPSSGGGGGGGGGGDSSISEKSSAYFELLRGDIQNFSLAIENRFADLKRNISVSVSGIKPEYIKIIPEKIPEIKPKSSENITVIINAPAYFNKGEYTLVFTIAGNIVANRTTPYKETKVVTLYIVEVERSKVDEMISKSYWMIDEMNSSNLVLKNILLSLETILKYYNEKDFLEVKNNYESLKKIYESAFASKKLIEELNQSIQDAERRGLSVLETKKLLYLAESSFKRGEYELALKTLEEAKMTYALETKGEFNLIYTIKNNPYETLFGLIGISLFSFGTSIAVRSRFYKRKQKLLGEEEKLLLELMKVVQKECFENNKMSMEEYNEAMSQYEEKLSKTIEERINIGTKLANLLKHKGKEKALKEEKARFIELIKDIQDKYLNKSQVETRIYNNLMKNYTIRISEIESSLAFIEAQEAMKEINLFRRIFKKEKIDKKIALKEVKNKK